MVRCYCRADEEEHDAMLMQEIDIRNFARQLLESRTAAVCASVRH